MCFRCTKCGLTLPLSIPTVVALGRKRKRASGGGDGSSKSRRWKRLLPPAIEYSSSLDVASAPPDALRPVTWRPPTLGPRSVLMHDPLSESLASSKKKAAKKPRIEGRGGSALGVGGPVFRARYVLLLRRCLFQILGRRSLTCFYFIEKPGVVDRSVSSEVAG